MTTRRLPLIATLLFFVQASLLAQGLGRATGDPFGGISDVSGTLETSDGHGVADARVDIRDLDGHEVASGFTNPSGFFHVSGMQRGAYELVVTKGLVEMRERLNLDGQSEMVKLRMPQEAVANTGTDAYVSVKEMKIPEKARKAYRKAEDAMRKGEMEQASKSIAEALEIAPDYAQALTLRGLLQLDARQYDNAQNTFLEAIRCDHSYPVAQLALGATYNMMSRYDDAIATLQKGLALDPRSWQGYFELGKAKVAKGELEDGIKQLDRAKSLAPDDYAPLHLVRAHAFMGLKDWSSAMSELEEYLRREPKGQVADAARQALEKARAFASVK